jgi:hypothetical protein
MMNQLKPPENGYQSRIRTSVIRLFRWCGMWAGTCALLAFGPRLLWHRALVLTLLAVGLNVCVGIKAILANKKYLEELDELQRKVQLNSFAITVGVAIIASVPYSLMDAYRVIPFHADISHLIMLMALTYGLANLYGTRRYR